MEKGGGWLGREGGARLVGGRSGKGWELVGERGGGRKIVEDARGKRGRRGGWLRGNT